MKRILVLMLAAACMLHFACGKSDKGDTSQQSRGTNELFLAVKDTTPTFTATVSAAQQMRAGVYSMPTLTDPAMNLAFQLLRSYSYPADEGKVDMTNIYKVLNEAGGYLDDAPSLCSTITSTIDSAISSYAFSDFLGHTYNCGGTRAETGGYGTSVAYRASGTDRFMLSSYKWAPDAAQQIAIGVIQTRFNSATKDVELTFAQTVNYPAGSSMGGATGTGFATRTFIKGNSGTHAFELKIAMVNQWGGTSIVGKGISKGAGNYFLMKNGTNYYCLPAGATETDLISIVTTTQAGVSANCSSYVAGVDALTQYNVSDPAHLPNYNNLTSFDLGVTGTPVKYLMF